MKLSSKRRPEIMSRVKGAQQLLANPRGRSLDRSSRHGSAR
jgi:hypothetical protein